MTDNSETTFNPNGFLCDAAEGTDNQYFRVIINGKSYRIDDPKATGHQLIRMSGQRPVDEYLIFLKLHGGGYEEIRLDETVDLTRPGAEQFFTFDSSASYRFVIDGERIEWGAKLITGLKLKEIAGVDPSTYAVWKEVRGGEDIPIANDQLVDLSEEGLERFFTVIEETTAGDDELPSADQDYLDKNGIDFEIMNEGGQIGIVLRHHALPHDAFDADLADILILLPVGYPDVPPDMFHCVPWLRLSSGGSYPKAADQSVQFGGQSWQRWSRHNKHWRSGTDGIWTMIKRVDCALRAAA